MPSENTIYLAAIISVSALLGYLYLKFVVQDEQDIEEIKQIELTYSRWESYIDIYLMPCGGTAEMLEDTKFNVAEMAMKHGFKYSPRLHVDLFGNRWGT